MLDRRLLALAVLALACNSGGSTSDKHQPPPPPPPPPPPAATCPEPIGLADVTNPTTVIGDGTAASCDEAKLTAALAAGGVITFNCGSAPKVISITSAKQVRTDVNTTIDGGGTVILDGGNTSRVFMMVDHYNGDGINWDATTPTLRLQRLTIRNARATGIFPEGGGAAVYHFGHALEVVDCVFQNNNASTSGTDVSGGAIYGTGLGKTTIVGSTFTGNSCASGGAVGVLANPFTLVNDVFDSNAAVSENGGAVTMDDKGGTWLVCGSVFTNNTAHALAGALFRSALAGEPTRIDKSLFRGNSAGQQGTVYLMGSPLTMTASAIVGNTTAHGAGGLWIGTYNANLGGATVMNSTIANNDAGDSLGGAIWIDNPATPLVLNHVTVAGNKALFQGGIGGSGSPGAIYRDTIIANNTGAPQNPELEESCYLTGSGSGVMQWPQNRPSGNPDVLCIPSPIFQDPQLGALADNGGATPTMAIPATSPAVGKGTFCTGDFATDQRGNARPATGCALGAYQP